MTIMVYLWEYPDGVHYIIYQPDCGVWLTVNKNNPGFTRTNGCIPTGTGFTCITPEQMIQNGTLMTIDQADSIVGPYLCLPYPCGSGHLIHFLAGAVAGYPPIYCSRPPCIDILLQAGWDTYRWCGVSPPQPRQSLPPTPKSVTLYLVDLSSPDPEQRQVTIDIDGAEGQSIEIRWWACIGCPYAEQRWIGTLPYTFTALGPCGCPAWVSLKLIPGRYTIRISVDAPSTYAWRVILGGYRNGYLPESEYFNIIEQAFINAVTGPASATFTVYDDGTVCGDPLVDPTCPYQTGVGPSPTPTGPTGEPTQVVVTTFGNIADMVASAAVLIVLILLLRVIVGLAR